MLETIRRYALDRLAEAGEAARLRDRHADAFLGLAESTAPILGTDPGSVDALGTDAANLSAAIDHTARTEPDKSLRLCAALAYWWLLTGQLVEGPAALTRALDATAGQRSSLRCGARFWRGYLAFFVGDYERTAREKLQASFEIAHGHGLRELVTWHWWMLGHTVYPTANRAAVRALWERSLEEASDLQDGLVSCPRSPGRPGRLAGVGHDRAGPALLEQVALVVQPRNVAEVDAGDGQCAAALRPASWPPCRAS